MYKMALGDEAMVRYGGRRAVPRVTFSGGLLVLPFIHRVQRVALTIRHIHASCMSRDASLTADGHRQDISAVFAVRVNRTSEAVLQAISTYGCEALGNVEHLTALLRPRFAEALRIGVSEFDRDTLPTQEARIRLKTIVHQVIGADLDGLILDDVNLEY